MTQIDRDLQRYADEYYTKKDLISGIKLLVRIVAEISGFLTVMLALMQLLSILSIGLSWVGLTLSPVLARNILYAASRGYVNANAEERKTLRAVASWITGGFSFEHFIGDEAVAWESTLQIAEKIQEVDELINRE